MSLLPPPEAIYPDPEAAFTAIQLHAKEQGYAFKKREKRSNRVVFTCDRAGKYDPKGKDPAVHKSKQRKATGSKMCGCFGVLEGAHNHAASTHITTHPVHRNKFLMLQKTLVFGSA